MKSPLHLKLAAVLALAVWTQADARIVRLEIITREPSGAAYETLRGRAYGEVDPKDPADALIQDLSLAPLNARGRVEYETDFVLIKPVDPARANGLLYYGVPNRGNVPGFDPVLQSRGYVFLASGWQGDVLPGGRRVTLKVPVATRSGQPITGDVRTEYVVNRATPTLGLEEGPYTGGGTHAPYQAVLAAKSRSILTRRARADDPKETIPGSEWAFSDSRATAFPGTASSSHISLQGGFQPGYIYELVYTAQNPLVLGLGFSATRDLVTFLRHEAKDDAGQANPLLEGDGANPIRAAVMSGVSQSGNYIRSFLQLGFNLDAHNRMVFEGANPDVAGKRTILNVRFATPGSGTSQHEGHLAPGHEAPFAWSSELDEVAGRRSGLLDRYPPAARPKIVQTFSSTEYWQYFASLSTTDSRGSRDLVLPENVRIYHFAGTQHSGGGANPSGDMRRALLVALERWILEGKAPPPSRYSTIREGTLVSPDPTNFAWPAIPGVVYNGTFNPGHLVDFGPQFNPVDESGVIAEPTKAVPGRAYAVLVPKVNADGNEIGGVQSVAQQVPLGTYTGWSLRGPGVGEADLNGLNGAFFPFRRTKEERLAANDPRPSLEERYGSHDGYMAAVKAAIAKLEADGFLLPEDAARAVQAAASSTVLRSSPAP
jgi:hypothetical protein